MLGGRLLVHVERGQAGVAEGGLGGGPVDLGDEAAPLGLVEQVEAGLQRVDLDGEERPLPAEEDEAVGREAGLLGHLPLGVGDPEVGRVLDRLRRRDPRAARDERVQIEREPEGDGDPRGGVAPGDRDLRAGGDLGRWEQALGEELGADDAPRGPPRAEGGVGEDGDGGRLVGREPVGQVERDGREDRVVKARGADGERVRRRNRERRPDGLRAQGLRGIGRAPTQRPEGEGDEQGGERRTGQSGEGRERQDRGPPRRARAGLGGTRCGFERA